MRPSASTLSLLSSSSVCITIQQHPANERFKCKHSNRWFVWWLFNFTTFFSPSYCLPLCGSWSAVMCYACDFVCSLYTWVFIYMHLLIMYVYLYIVLVILCVPIFIHTICSVTTILTGREENLTSITLAFFNSLEYWRLNRFRSVFSIFFNALFTF